MLENLWNVDSIGKQKNHEIINGKPGRAVMEFRLRESVGLFGEFLLVRSSNSGKRVQKNLLHSV